jgi:hypothetical protein
MGGTVVRNLKLGAKQVFKFFDFLGGLKSFYWCCGVKIEQELLGQFSSTVEQKLYH